jgi:Protein kinase domain
MSPEQIAGRTRDLGPATDIWALGVMLYELLAGQRPFVGSDPGELREKIQAARPTRLGKVRPDVPAELEGIVQRCLQRKPTRRYLSAAALADDLARWQRGERIPKQWPILWVAAMLALIAVVAGSVAAAVYLRPGSNSPDPVSPPGPKPEEEIAKLLVGGLGPPRQQFRWVTGEKDAQIVSGEPGEPFTLRSDDTSVLELMPASPWGHYRLEAKVTHRNSKDGSAGIVIGHVEVKAAKDPHHVFWCLTFSEEGQWRGTRGMSIGSYGTAYSSFPIDRSAFEFPPSAGSERSLALEVDSAGVSAYWGTERFAFANPGTAKLHVESILDSPRNPEKEALPQGGIGLVVRKGEATFRQVVIRRLP